MKVDLYVNLKLGASGRGVARALDFDVALPDAVLEVDRRRGVAGRHAVEDPRKRKMDLLDLLRALTKELHRVLVGPLELRTRLDRVHMPADPVLLLLLRTRRADRLEYPDRLLGLRRPLGVEARRATDRLVPMRVPKLQPTRSGLLARAPDRRP